MVETSKSCEQCERAFIARRATARFCGRSCAAEYGRLVYREKRSVGNGQTRGRTIHYAVDGIKRCRDCDLTKPVNEFPKRAASLDGFRPQCKDCKRAHHQDWVENNRAELEEQRKRFYKENRERVLGQRRARRLARRDELLEARREYYKKNAHILRERSRQHRLANPESAKAVIARWRKNNPQKVAVLAHRRRARIASAPTIPYTITELSGRWEVFGSKCYICASPAEATDHVKPLAAGGSDMPSNLRPICASCNSAKRGDWLGIDLYDILIDWVRDGVGPLPDQYREIANQNRSRTGTDDGEQSA